MRALYLDDMTGDVVVVLDDTTPTLQFMQHLVDGLIEFASIDGSEFDYVPFEKIERLASRNDLVVNEEGLFNEVFAYNKHASDLAGFDLVGPALIVGREGPETVSVHINDVATVLECLNVRYIGTMTVDEVCRKYIVPRGTWDLSEAWS